MTEIKTNLYKKGNRCRICTGCGRCFSEKPLHVISGFLFPKNAEEIRESGNNLPPYLIVADIGTTTIAMQLRRAADGKVLDTYVQENPQRQYGADVLSRIEAAKEVTVKEAMRDAVRDALSHGLRSFCISEQKGEEDGVNQENSKLVIAANTTMVHLLMDYATEGLGQFPFVAENLKEIHTVLFGFETLILPGMSAFVGGDILADIVALSMQKRSEITLLVDLGTNGEIVLGNKNRLLATSTAAGPAFECGTENFGTDMVALTAKLLAEGIVDETGLLCEPYFEEGITIGGIRMTRQYIRSLQTAKAAICTGISILASQYGLQNLGQIDKVFIAGGMGYYLDLQAATRIGLLPKVLEEKTHVVGNAVLEGAYLYAKEQLAMLADKCETVNLAEKEEFNDMFIANMNLKPFTESSV